MLFIRMDKLQEEKKKYTEIADKVVVKLSSEIVRGETLISLVNFINK